MTLAVSLNSFLAGYSTASASQVPKVGLRKVAGPSGSCAQSCSDSRSIRHNHSLVTSEGSTTKRNKKEDLELVCLKGDGCRHGWIQAINRCSKPTLAAEEFVRKQHFSFSVVLANTGAFV